MAIRFGNPTDKKEYLKVQKEAFPKSDLKREAKFFYEKIKKREILVLEEGDYVGHLAFGKHLIEPPFAKSIFIEELAISKRFRGKGLGKELIIYLEKYCKQNRIPIIYLATGDYKGNKSHSFYKKLGFKMIGRLKNILPDEEYDYGQIFYGKIVMGGR